MVLAFLSNLAIPQTSGLDKRKGVQGRAPGRGKKERARRLPTLPRKDRSTIGVEGLDFRVRDGNGYGPLAVAAGPAHGRKHLPGASALRPPAEGGNDDVAKPHG